MIEASINIHGEESPDGRLRFGLEENPRSKVRASAKNDKLWQQGVSAAEMGQTVYSGKDIEHVRNTLRHILIPETRQSSSRVIALGPNWQSDPWADVDDLDKPSKWDRPVLIVMPEPLQTNKGKRVDALGKWLASHVSAKRNTVRFLLPADGEKGIYQDAELLFCSRCSYLTSIAWRDDSKYRGLKEEFDKPLRFIRSRAFRSGQERFMPPIVVSHNEHHIVMGQRKWKVQGGFPHVCHGGLSLLEVAVPFIELPPL